MKSVAIRRGDGGRSPGKRGKKRERWTGGNGENVGRQSSELCESEAVFGFFGGTMKDFVVERYRILSMSLLAKGKVGLPGEQAVCLTSRKVGNASQRT
jgi:hypothetical protein